MKSMARPIHRIDEPFSAGLCDWRLSDALSEDERPETPPSEGSADYRATLDEGLRLNRAFFSIRSASIRAAIIDLIVEAANRENADDTRFPPPIKLRR
jgi:hypothetical protein